MSYIKTFIRLSKFALCNPRLTLHNLSIERVKKLFGKLRQSNGDLSQWLDIRLPESTPQSPLELARVAPGEVLNFPITDSPLVSIIIPVYNQGELTLSLLKSLHEHTTPAYEIIIADDASTENMQQTLSCVNNIQYLHNDSNLGFLRNCNHAAECARGDYLLFLNNDTNVSPGWLDALLDPFRDKDVGIVGPRILFQNGQLQEAGGIVWRDGSAWNYGRQGDASAPEFNYVKEVDYVSGCCLLVKRKLWQQAGGFDERYAPAYYEDTDLCFTARRLGYRVIYQPAARVLHLEGATHGTQIGQGVKQHQQINQQRFAQKWQTVLSSHPPNGTDIFHARDRSYGKKTLVFIDQLVPHHDQDAGSRAVFMILKTLQALEYRIIFIPHSFCAHQPYTGHLQQRGIEVLYGARYAANIYKWLENNEHNIDVVFINRPMVAKDYLPLLKRVAWRKVYFGHDLHFLRQQREHDLDQQSTQKTIDRIKAIELEVARAMDVVYYPSTLEVQLLRKDHGIQTASVLPLFIYPEQGDLVQRYNAEAREGLLFVGGYSHPPNIDAVLWFHDSILPHLSADIGPIHIVGANPPEKISALDSARFRILGRVSDEELTALYARVRLVIVPLRFGAGVKGKVLEALYHGVPLVSTSIGTEGIPDIEPLVFTAEDSLAFAQTINDRYPDTALLNRLSESGKALIAEHFNDRRLKRILQQDLIP